MTEQEKRFLEKLGITDPEVRYYEDGNYWIVNGWIEEIKITHNNVLMLLKSSEMFLSLFKTTKKNVEIGCPKCAYNFPKKDCNKCGRPVQVKTLESATGKTFGQLCEIWESYA